MVNGNVIDLRAAFREKAAEPKADDVPPRPFGIRFEPGCLVTTMGAYLVVAVPVHDDEGNLVGKAMHAFNRFNGVRLSDEETAQLVEPFTDPVGFVGPDGRPL